MTLRRRLIKGSSVLLAGQVLSQGISFVRNVVVARLISPDDFGIAAMFVITVSLLEMISDLAWDKMLIQDPNGNKMGFQATAQLMMFCRGVANAVLIFLLAWPISVLFKVPEARWAFHWLALVPLLRGMLHLDCKRFHREMKFRADITVEVVSQVLAVLAAWPLAAWLGDYTAMLWVVILQSAVLCVGSHLLARRPYRWAWDRLFTNRILAFGWPLVINGLLMFGIFEGDKLIIGAAYTMAELGVYVVAFTLTMIPTMMIARVFTSLLLPVLSREQDSPDRFRQYYRLCTVALSVISAAIVIPFVIGGGVLIVRVYGKEYAQASEVIGWLAVAQGVRLLRIGPTLAVLAVGDTVSCMMVSLFRASALLGVTAVAALQLDLFWIALCALIGEILALIFLLCRLRLRHQLLVDVGSYWAFVAWAAIVLTFNCLYYCVTGVNIENRVYFIILTGFSAMLAFVVTFRGPVWNDLRYLFKPFIVWLKCPGLPRVHESTSNLIVKAVNDSKD